MKKFMIGAAVLAATFVTTPAMAAGSANGSLAVNALVLESCTVIALPLAFGAIADVGGVDVDTTATLTLACTPNADYEIALDNGQNDNSGQRRMKSAAADEYLPYEIYKDETRLSRWGNTANTTTLPGKANALGVSVLTAYGRIASGTESVTAGLYSDTVTVTVNF